MQRVVNLGHVASAGALLLVMGLLMVGWQDALEPRVGRLEGRVAILETGQACLYTSPTPFGPQHQFITPVSCLGPTQTSIILTEATTLAQLASLSPSPSPSFTASPLPQPTSTTIRVTIPTYGPILYPFTANRPDGQRVRTSPTTSGFVSITLKQGDLVQAIANCRVANGYIWIELYQPKGYTVLREVASPTDYWLTGATYPPNC